VEVNGTGGPIESRGASETRKTNHPSMEFNEGAGTKGNGRGSVLAGGQKLRPATRWTHEQALRTVTQGAIKESGRQPDPESTPSRQRVGKELVAEQGKKNNPGYLTAPGFCGACEISVERGTGVSHGEAFENTKLTGGTETRQGTHQKTRGTLCAFGGVTAYAQPSSPKNSHEKGWHTRTRSKSVLGFKRRHKMGNVKTRRGRNRGRQPTKRPRLETRKRAIRVKGK